MPRYAMTEKQNRIYEAICAVELASQAVDEDDNETTIKETAERAIEKVRQLGVPHTNREWVNILGDLAAMHEREQHASARA